MTALARYLMLKKELSRIADSMEEIRTQKTNRQLTVNTQQPQVNRLAVAVNALYSDMDAEKAASRTKLEETRQSMANISHDLRTPLTSILGYLKLLQKGGNSKEQEQHYLSVAYNKAGALNQLVEGIFKLARLESGSYVFNHQRLDAAALLAEELAGSYTQMVSGSLHPQIQLPDAPLWVVGDPDVLPRVFANLLSNMIKHGKDPMEIGACVEGKNAVFRFSNKAPGLTQEDTKQLFTLFFTADRMRSGKSTGLGLAIVKEFVEQMNGSITAELQNGILVFTLYFPLIP